MPHLSADVLRGRSRSDLLIGGAHTARDLILWSKMLLMRVEFWK